MNSGYSANFHIPATSSSHITSRSDDDDEVDLEAIIQELGELELQLTCRESQLQAATAASLVAKKSVTLDRELQSVLQELNHLESEESYNGSLSGEFIEQFSPKSDYCSNLSGENQNSYLFDDLSPCLHVSESKNLFGTLSSQSSHSSETSTESGKATQVTPQSLVRIYSPDGTSKTIAVDEQTTVGKACEILARKHRVMMSLNWAIVEHIPALQIERILEDHLSLMDQLNLWTKDSKNKLIYMEKPEKYSMFNDKEVRDAAQNNSFSPNVEGFLHFKLNGKKSWKKLYFVLRASGIYYSPKGKVKTTSDLVCLQGLQGVEFYFGVDWKKCFKSPTEFGFALKLPIVQKEVPKFIRFFCAEDRQSLMHWFISFRLAKHGCQLLNSYTCALSRQTSQRTQTQSFAVKCKTNHSAEDTTDAVVQDLPGDEPHLLEEKMSEIESNTEYGLKLSPVHKYSSDGGTLKKSIPNIPITTHLTRHLSLQHQKHSRSLSKPLDRPKLLSCNEDETSALPSASGNFMRFPSPDFSLDQPTSENCSYIPDTMATLPRKSGSKMSASAISQLGRVHVMPKRQQTNPEHHYYDSSSLKTSSSSMISDSYCRLISSESPPAVSVSSGFSNQKAPSSSDMIYDKYGYVICNDMLPPPPTLSGSQLLCQDISFLPPPPPIEPGCRQVTASNQDLPLPPPPPELLCMDSNISQEPSFNMTHRAHSDYPTLKLSGTPDLGRASSFTQPTTPPAPPTRSAATKLSFFGGNSRTKHVVMDLDRVMVQKHEQGADGLTNLEIPLPPPPCVEEGSLENLDHNDLPPPPAEILESIKQMRNRPLPPLPSGSSPYRPIFSKVI